MTPGLPVGGSSASAISCKGAHRQLRTAVVMASASVRGDTVHTSDPADLAKLQASVPHFSNIRVLVARLA